MKAELAQTTERLIDDISVDPENWRAQEERIRQVIAAHDRAGLKLPAHLKVYGNWLAQEDDEDLFENMPI